MAKDARIYRPRFVKIKFDFQAKYKYGIRMYDSLPKTVREALGEIELMESH
jgi:hypothetical protein